MYIENLTYSWTYLRNIKRKKFKSSYEVFINNLDNDQFCRPVKTKKKIKREKIVEFSFMNVHVM